MKNTITNHQSPINVTKRQYQKPEVKRVILDNEISLVMQSAPSNPGWSKADEPTSTPNPFRDEESSC
jgi:hypothetical protein